MAKREVNKSLAESERKAIFLALVQAQDGDMTVARSRKLVAEQFAISEGQLKRIEQEGLDAGWPPLD